MQNDPQHRSQDERESLGEQILAYWRREEALRHLAREDSKLQDILSESR